MTPTNTQTQQTISLERLHDIIAIDIDKALRVDPNVDDRPTFSALQIPLDCKEDDQSETACQQRDAAKRILALLDAISILTQEADILYHDTFDCR